MRKSITVVLSTALFLGGCATGHPPRPTTPVYGRAPGYQPAPPPPYQPTYQTAVPPYGVVSASQAPPYAPAQPPYPPQPAYPAPAQYAAAPPQYSSPPYPYPAPQPQYQPASVDPQQAQIRDTEECKQWAYQQTGFEGGADAAKGAVVGGAVGALGAAALGAAIGAIAGGGKAAGKGAAIGAVAGGLGGAAIGGTYNYSRSKDGYEQAFAACMKGRGYLVP